jgi:aerotaxis receptor
MVASLPDATKPDATAEPITMTYHDGASRIIYDTGIERPYPDGKLIVSRTDLAGNITHVNDAFVEISGYDIDELIGKPHYILRHPDMPKAAYKDLWSTAEAGQKWHGYVPNVRRGETVGYTSVRRKPSRSKIADATTQYAQMKQDEEG